RSVRSDRQNAPAERWRPASCHPALACALPCARPLDGRTPGGQPPVSARPPPDRVRPAVRRTPRTLGRRAGNLSNQQPAVGTGPATGRPDTHATRTHMIPDTSAQDRPLSHAGQPPAWRRWLLPAAAAAGVLVLAGWVVSGWSAGARSYDASRLRIAEVKRGDLVRDLSADGRVITANSPVLYAIAGGTVSLQVVAGDVVEKGQVLAVIDSPELRSKLVQEESTLASMEAEASRAQLDARIASLNAHKARDQAQIDHTAAQ